MTPCPSRADLRNLLADRLPTAQECPVLAHVETCPACQATLEELTAGCAPSASATAAADGVGPPTAPAPEADALWRGLKAAPLAPPPTPPAGPPCGLGPEKAGEAEAAHPAHVGRYEVREEIGRGGMGAVLHGHDPDLGRDLAVKVLLPDHQHDPAAVSRFLEEAQIGGQLQHPGIVPVYEVGRSAEQPPYFTMKLVRGRTLAALLRERPDPRQDLPRFLQVFEQVCQTMAYAHSRGVVHRDLKPSNVMVGAFGEVQVMDWGLAKVLDGKGEASPDSKPRAQGFAPGVIRTVRSTGSGPVSQPGSVLGTPAYMAPEQASGAADHLDARCDVFGLGAILCEILTGQPPYRGAEDVQVLEKAARADLVEGFARLDACGADPELIRLARSSLAAEAGDRPRDAAALAAALAGYRESMEARLRRAELERAEARVKAAEERKRRRLAVGLAAALLALGTGAAAAGLWYQHDRARRDHDEALRRGGLEGGAAAAARVAKARRGETLTLVEQPAAWQAALAQAQAAARQAEVLLAQAGELADPDLRRRVQELTDGLEADERDRALVARVDHLRLEQSNLVAASRSFKRWQSWPELREALEQYGLRVGDAEGAVAPMRGRPEPVCAKLVAALDFCLANAVGTEAGVRAWLVAVLAGVDGDPWRTQVRRVAAEGDGPAVARLVQEGEVGRQPPAFLALLAADFRLPSGPDRINLLRHAQRIYPGDFWVNHDLASELYLHVHPGAYRVAAADELPLVEEAIGFLRAALALRPASAAVYNELGNVLYFKRELAGAVTAFGQAIALDPKYAPVHSNLGDALLAQGDLAGAIAAFRRAIALDPKYAPVHSNLSTALRAQGDLAGAVAAYRRAIALDPKLAPVHSNLGDALLAQGDLAGAIAADRQAIALDPRSAHAHNNLGNALLAQGDVSAALAAFHEAIALDPR